MPEIISPDANASFQYHSAKHQASTALAGMWLFLSTEVLFFGGLVFGWAVYRFGHPAGFHVAAEHANLLIGSINTALLVTSSAVFTWGVGQAQQGRNRELYRACWITAGLGVAFLLLKGLEWYLDVREHLLPGAGFGLQGPDRDGAQLFYIIYWIATSLHGLHMLVGIALVAWIAMQARRNGFSRASHTRVQVVGLFWSFVDVVWLTFYPLIYVAARP